MTILSLSLPASIVNAHHEGRPVQPNTTAADDSVVMDDDGYTEVFIARKMRASLNSGTVIQKATANTTLISNELNSYETSDVPEDAEFAISKEEAMAMRI